MYNILIKFTRRYSQANFLLLRRPKTTFQKIPKIQGVGLNVTDGGEGRNFSCVILDSSRSGSGLKQF